MKKRILAMLLLLSLTVCAVLGACAPAPSESSETESDSGSVAESTTESTESEDTSMDNNETGTPKDYPTLCGNFMQPGTFKGYTPDKMKSHLQTMKDVGIDILILQWSFENVGSQATVSYFESSFDASDKADSFDESGKMLLDTILQAAEEIGVKVFVGLNNNDEWWQKGVLDKAWLTAQAELGVKGARQIYDTYKAKYPNALHGWYFVYEFYNMDANEEMRNNAAHLLNGFLDGLTEIDDTMPMMLSPFISAIGVSAEKTGDLWTDVFAKTNFREGDIFCCQDSVGAGHITLEKLDSYYREIKRAVDSKEGLHFWANNEDFTQSSWTTAPLDRFVEQMNISSKYVEAHITFAYSHYQHPDMGKTGHHLAYKYYYENGKLPTETTFGAPEVTFEAPDGGVSVSINGKLANEDKSVKGFLVTKNGEELKMIDLSSSYGKVNISFSLDDFNPSGSGVAQYTVCGVDYFGNRGPAFEFEVEFSGKDGVNVAEGKSYTTLKPAEANYPDEQGNALTDGKYGEATYGDAAWVGFLGKPEFVIDLGEKTDGIYSVVVNTMGGGSAAIYAPTNVTVYVSDDGENFTQAVSKTFEPDSGTDKLEAVVRTAFLPQSVSARYVKVAISTNQSWIFVDEISVYAEE